MHFLNAVVMLKLSPASMQATEVLLQASYNHLHVLNDYLVTLRGWHSAVNLLDHVYLAEL